MNRIIRSIKKEAQAQGYQRRVRKHLLQWIEIEITRRCPLSCLHCGSSCSESSFYKNELSTTEILNFLKQFDNAYGAANLMLCFTGGEPLLRPDLFGIIAQATEMGYRATMVSNGMLINHKIVDLLAASGLSTITISLDGMEATHNWMRNNPLSFKHAIEALKLLKTSGYFHVVEALTCVSKRTLRELPQIRALLRELGADHWRLTRIFPLGRALEHRELLLDRSELKEMLNTIKEFRRREPDFLTYGEEGCLGNEYDYQVRSEPQHCDAGIHILTLLADGSITGCASIDHCFIQGNIKDDDPVALWENAFLPFRNRSWMQKGICGRCNEWRYCHGDGMHLWEPDRPNPVNCIYLQLEKNVVY